MEGAGTRFCATVARLTNVHFTSILAAVTSPLTATLGASQLAAAGGTHEYAVRRIWVPNDALLARRDTDDAAATRRACRVYCGGRQSPRRVPWRRMVRRDDNKLNGLINAAKHKVMSAVDDATLETRQ